MTACVLSTSTSIRGICAMGDHSRIPESHSVDKRASSIPSSTTSALRVGLLGLIRTDTVSIRPAAPGTRWYRTSTVPEGSLLAISFSASIVKFYLFFQP
jgi:hypothetical protein